MTMILDGTNGAFLPTWTTATRPASPANGEIGYNSTTGQIDQYVGSAWSSVPTAGASQATPTALGTVYASTLNLSGNATTAVGYQACRVDAGSSNTAFGATALYTNTSGARNVAVGYSSLYSNNGSENTAVGVQALQVNTSGSGNTAIGIYASASNTTGTYNTSVGYSALQLTTTGYRNTALGTSALYSNTTGLFNVAVGSDALALNTSGSNNTAIGRQALYTNTTSNECVAIGEESLYYCTGAANTGVGRLAGYNVTSGSTITCLGYYTIPAAGTDTGEIVIGAYATGKGSATGFISPNGGGVYQGNNSAAWSVASDFRLKKNIVDNNVGLEKVIQIQVRNFEYRTENEVTDLPKNQAIAKQGVQLGVIAQELQQVLPDCVKQESTGVLAVDSTDIMYHMINAIKELNAEIQALKAKVGI